MNTALQELLRENGLRSTKQRMAVLAALEKNTFPMSISDIAHTPECRKFDQVTIYRTLESFAAKKLVTETDLKRGRKYYERAGDGRAHHHHLVCNSCGRVEDVTDCDMEAIERSVLHRSKHFKEVESHALEFFGACATCVTK